MNTFKKLLGLLLAAVMIFTFAACHPKDEVALTVGDVEITSALYMAALISADGEAKTKVDEANAETSSTDSSATSSAATSSTAVSSTVDYLKEKVEDTDYSTWVKNRALEICSEWAAYETKCKENDITVSEEEQEEIDYYVDYYWTYYGYQQIYETNGVSKETFKKSFTYSYLYNAYFEALYGEGGEKAVAADEVKKAIEENFVIANVLTASTKDLKDAEKTETVNKFNNYITRLNKGASFEEIYNEYYEIKEDDKTTSSSATSSTTEEEKKPEPKDKYASVLGSEDTSYADDNYKTVKEMAIGERKLINDEENGTLTILIRGDLFGDEYWTENLNTPALALLKQEEFDKDMEEYAKTLKVEKNSFAIDRFKVKNIEYPTAQ